MAIGLDAGILSLACRQVSVPHGPGFLSGKIPWHSVAGWLLNCWAMIRKSRIDLANLQKT